MVLPIKYFGKCLSTFWPRGKDYHKNIVFDGTVCNKLTTSSLTSLIITKDNVANTAFSGISQEKVTLCGNKTEEIFLTAIAKLVCSILKLNDKLDAEQGKPCL